MPDPASPTSIDLSSDVIPALAPQAPLGGTPEGTPDEAVEPGAGSGAGSGGGYVLPPPPRPAVPVEGEAGLFPVRRVYCVGRNYAAHAREMGKDPDREPPFFFMKPADALVVCTPSGSIPYPPDTNDLHHEVELVVAIGTGGVDIAAERALDHVFGYAVGIDLTRRDRQGEAKDAGRPWEWGKAFDRSAPVGPIRRAGTLGHPSRGAVTLTVDGARRQAGDLSELIWSVPEIIATLSRSMALKPGDLIFTGTPAGVAAVKPGQTMRAEVEGVGAIEVRIEAA